MPQAWGFARSELAKRKLLFVTSFDADFRCLDLDSFTSEGECRVLLVSHETIDPEREWASIAEFIEDMMTEGPAG